MPPVSRIRYDIICRSTQYVLRRLCRKAHTRRLLGNAVPQHDTGNSFPLGRGNDDDRIAVLLECLSHDDRTVHKHERNARALCRSHAVQQFPDNGGMCDIRQPPRALRCGKGPLEILGEYGMQKYGMK